MERYFNTAGPVRESEHYIVPPLERWDLEEILALIRQGKYFVLHAPRQTGKTSCLDALMNYLNAEGNYTCAYANIEAAQAHRGDFKEAMLTIFEAIAAETSPVDSFLEDHREEFYKKFTPAFLVYKALSEWSQASEKPVVLFLDEVDALVGDTLISLLRQLRTGYKNRPQRFPLSIVLCGVRDIIDYRIHSESEKDIITGGSAFNVKAKSLRLGLSLIHI